MFLIVGCGGDGSSDDVSLASLLVTVPNNINPVAKTTKTSITVTQGQNIILDASNSTDEDGNIVSYSWQLANGTVLGTSQVLKYNSSKLKTGTYNIRLVVTDDAGATDVTVIEVKVKSLRQ